MSDQGQPSDDPSPSCSGSGSTSANDNKRKHDDDEDVLTMLDVLQDEEALEEDAQAVLGNSDDKNCSYTAAEPPKRQALYSCITCSDPSAPSFKPAAICLACSYECHPSHTLVELYTKRNFCCDCGTDKFPDNPCKLCPDKTPKTNKEYNQNFRGLYCTCHRPYPDPEDETPDEMIQCIICEDWYHGRHLEGIDKLPADNSYAEMICHLCYSKFQDFLAAYKGLAVTQVNDTKDDAKVEDAKVVDVEAAADESAENLNDSIYSESKNGSTSTCDKEGCLVTAFRKKPCEKEDVNSALFLPSGWREQLCRCSDCKQMYANKKISFLLDPEDTVHHYESQAKEKSVGSQYEDGLRALGELYRVQQVEAIRGYNEMKDELRDYLAAFARDGRVVTQEDIQNFFERMKANKRQRLEIPKFCR